MTVQVNITTDGRISLPAGRLMRLRLQSGGAILLEETKEGVALRTVGQAVARAQAIAKKYASHPDASVDTSLANRRAESGE